MVELTIGILADPLKHPDWSAIEAFLEPAAKRGGVPIIEPGEQVWGVWAPELTGAATARTTTDGFGEVILVGGRDHRRWIAELDEMIGRWLRDEGMRSVRAYGRKGWVRVLKDWTIIGTEGANVAYERTLQ